MAQEKETLQIECFKCGNCGNVTLSPGKVCHSCGSKDIKAAQAEGKGKVVDFTTVYYPPDNYKDMAPYTSVLVRLSNGCQLFGVMLGEIKNIYQGRPVQATKRDEATGGVIFQLV